MLKKLCRTRTGCLSIQVLQEFYWNATRKMSSPLTVAVARQLIEDYSRWPVHSPTTAVVLDSIDLHATHQVSFWDSLILGSANYLGASIVWSGDMNHGQRYGKVEVRNPFR